ncbi:MAG TPA: hypothetical protein VFQ53_07765 [Kofleriaceae bacterium]|nr:hypothetical protein [Kofleriaceae bacterium]
MRARILTLSALVLAVATTARADVEHSELRPVAARSMTLSALGQDGKLSGLHASGWGVNLELALGKRRWQYFVEGSLSWLELGPRGAQLDGRQQRGGLGVRWLARSFELGSVGSFDLNLEAFTGIERFDVAPDVLVRPDLGVGIGWQVRLHLCRDLAMRTMARVVFAPTDRDAASAVCRGSCEMPVSRDSSGLMIVSGFQW